MMIAEQPKASTRLFPKRSDSALMKSAEAANARRGSVVTSPIAADERPRSFCTSMHSAPIEVMGARRTAAVNTIAKATTIRKRLSALKRGRFLSIFLRWNIMVIHDTACITIW